MKMKISHYRPDGKRKVILSTAEDVIGRRKQRRKSWRNGEAKEFTGQAKAARKVEEINALHKAVKKSLRLTTHNLWKEVVGLTSRRGIKRTT